MANISDRNAARLQSLQQLVIGLGRIEFETQHPDLRLQPVVALICAYEEEENLGPVLSRVPSEVLGLGVTPLVVVDGGSDGTAEVARKAGAVTFVFPVNLGHGVALRVGYDLCLHHGAQYVVTLDADGQNDPAEMETMLAPLVGDTADFVVASRRLGVDETSDRFRQLGVRVFSALMSALTGAHLTDTSNGYRALRVTMLSDVVDHLEQDQYQTAELLITCLERGWRVTERPTVWRERLHGSSKKGANLAYGFRYASVLLGTWWRGRRRIRPQ